MCSVDGFEGDDDARWLLCVCVCVCVCVYGVEVMSWWHSVHRSGCQALKMHRICRRKADRFENQAWVVDGPHPSTTAISFIHPQVVHSITVHGTEESVVVVISTYRGIGQVR